MAQIDKVKAKIIKSLCKLSKEEMANILMEYILEEDCPENAYSNNNTSKIFLSLPFCVREEIISTINGYENLLVSLINNIEEGLKEG